MFVENIRSQTRTRDNVVHGESYKLPRFSHNYQLWQCHIAQCKGAFMCPGFERSVSEIYSSIWIQLGQIFLWCMQYWNTTSQQLHLFPDSVSPRLDCKLMTPGSLCGNVNNCESVREYAALKLKMAPTFLPNLETPSSRGAHSLFLQLGSLVG